MEEGVNCQVKQNRLICQYGLCVLAIISQKKGVNFWKIQNIALAVYKAFISYAI
jgi:hypothetical protein